MEPSYRPGDKVPVKNTHGSAVRDGDVVLFDGRGWGIQAPLLERVIARGGEHLTITATGTVTVDGAVLKEPYLSPGSLTTSPQPVDLLVPPGRLFMMGDHRADALDSRYHSEIAHGTIAESAVTGKAVDAANAPDPDYRWATADAATAVAGLAAAITIGTRTGAGGRNRHHAPPPPPPPSAPH